MCKEMELNFCDETCVHSQMRSGNSDDALKSDSDTVSPLSQDTDGPETFREREISLDSNAACPEAKDTTELRPNEPDHYAVPPYRESLTVYCVY